MFVSAKNLSERVNGKRFVQFGFFVFILAVLLRFVFLGFESSDYIGAVDLWLKTLDAQGFSAFRERFYDYNPPYLYMLYVINQVFPALHLVTVKTVSFLFDLSLAAACGALINSIYKNRAISFCCAALVLILPEVVLNGAIWGQVDAAYTSLILWSLLLLSRNKNVGAWILYGCAIAFKSQALFVLPAFLLIMLLRRDRIWSIFAGLAAFFVWYIPCLIAGRSFISLLSIYFIQVSTYGSLNMGAPNLYRILTNTNYTLWRTVAFGITFGMLTALCIFLYKRYYRVPLTSVKILKIVLPFALLVPFCLPQMHERYFYLAGILSIIVVLADRAYLWVAVLIQLGNTMASAAVLMNPLSKPYFPSLSLDTWRWFADISFLPETLAVVLLLRVVIKRVATSEKVVEKKFQVTRSDGTAQR